MGEYRLTDVLLGRTRFAIPTSNIFCFYATPATCRCIVASQPDAIIRHVDRLEDILLCMASSRTTTRHNIT